MKFRERIPTKTQSHSTCAGTGESRNAAELHKTAYKCFDGTYFEKNEELASRLRHPFVFHVSLESRTGLQSAKSHRCADAFAGSVR